MRAGLALVTIGAAGLLGCSDSKSASLAPAPLQVFAFPHEVEPGGEATVTVHITADAHCVLVCVAVPAVENSGRLYPPPGVELKAGSSIALPAEDAAVYQSITYVAPSHEGSEVVSAACYANLDVDCSQTQPAQDVKATATARIVIRKPSPDSTSGGEPGSAGGAPGSGGSAGSDSAGGAPSSAGSAGADAAGGAAPGGDTGTTGGSAGAP